ncbi:MAG: hypothetical protein ACAH10_03400 [Methylophilaceae bacterium]
MSDYLTQHLADLPEVVDVPTLAAKCGWGVGTIYQRSKKKKKNHDQGLLPEPLIVPGGNQLLFSRVAVIDWFRSAVKEPAKKAGRPRGAISRRGVGRAELEASLAGEER